MADIARVRNATDRHSAAREALVIQLLKLLLGLWSGFSKWDDRDLVNGMAARSATIVESASRQARILNRSYISSVLRELQVMPEALPPLVDSYPRSNATASDVYRRPVDQFIWARRNGLSVGESQTAFEERLKEIAAADVAAAEREEAQLVYAATPNVSGYRRVIHPELSKSGTCGLCIVASAQVYRTDELMPLHGGTCNCDTLPITGKDDPGLRINDDDLKTIYAAAGPRKNGSTSAEDLVNTRIKINEHGELGPVLVKKGDHFRTAAEAGRPQYVKPTPASIRSDSERELADLQGQLEQANARFNALSGSDRFDSDGNSTTEAIALFRSVRYLGDRITYVEMFLKRLTP